MLIAESTPMIPDRLHPPSKKKKKKKNLIIIAACCASSTVVHMAFHRVSRVCIKSSAIFTWPNPFNGVLSASMSYTGSPYINFKTTLLTFIIASYVVAIIILDIYMFCHGFCNMIILGGIFFLLLCTPSDLGTSFLQGSLSTCRLGEGDGVATHGLHFLY